MAVADKISVERRSANMAKIRATDTQPELAVRKRLTRLGYRYRVHFRPLPGRPDIAFTARRKVLWVHGCFWHLHGCVDGRLPTSRVDYWKPKLEGNRRRDKDRSAQLAALGWESMVVWDCEVAKDAGLDHRLIRYLGPPRYLK